jgi:hypothetical protein
MGRVRHLGEVPFGHVGGRLVPADGAQVDDRVTQLAELDDLPLRPFLPHKGFIAAAAIVDTPSRS